MGSTDKHRLKSMASVEAYLEHRWRRFLVVTLSLTALLVIASLINLAVGSAVMNPLSVFSNGLHQIFYSRISIEGYRVERLSSAIIVGVALAISGYLIQSASKNPLGDPYLLGISSGALLFVVITFLIPVSLFSLFVLRPIAAFAGGLIAYLLTLMIASKAGMTPTTLVLSGVAVGTALYSLSLLPQYLVLRNIHRIFIWSQGSFIDPSPQGCMIVFSALIASFLLISSRLSVINALNVSDDVVKELGRSPELERKIMTFTASLLASLTVAWYGIIGFIGLASPHIARRLLRTGDARLILPSTVLVGSFLTVISDAVAKSVFYPIEIPVNIVISIFGGPALALILAGMRQSA